MSKRTTIIVIAAVAVVALGAWFVFQSSRTSQRMGANDAASTQQLTHVSARIKWFTYASYMGTYVGRDAGYCAKRGLDVSIFEGGPTVDAAKLVAAGSNDFGEAGGDQILVARSKGLPIVAIAAEMQHTPSGYMVYADSDIHSMRDFPGHTIRIISGHNTEIEYRAVMRKLGIDTKTIKEVFNNTELQLLYAHQIDIEPIYVNNQPPKAEAQGIKFRILTPEDYGVDSYGNTYFTTEKMIRDHPQIVQAFVSCVLDGWKESFADPGAAVDMLLKDSPILKRDIELKQLALTRPLMTRPDGKIGLMSDERWKGVSDMLLSAGLINKPVDVGQAYTNQFVTNYYADEAAGK